MAMPQFKMPATPLFDNSNLLYYRFTTVLTVSSISDVINNIVKLLFLCLCLSVSVSLFLPLCLVYSIFLLQTTDLLRMRGCH